MYRIPSQLFFPPELQIQTQHYSLHDSVNSSELTHTVTDTAFWFIEGCQESLSLAIIWMEETDLTDTALTFKAIYFISVFVFLLDHICHNFLSRCYSSIQSLTFCCSDRDYTEVLLFWKKIKLYCVSWVQTAGLFLNPASWAHPPMWLSLIGQEQQCTCTFLSILPRSYQYFTIHCCSFTQSQAICLCPLQLACSR